MEPEGPRMRHPFTLIQSFQAEVASGRYKRAGQVAAEKYRNVLTNVDPYERLAQVYATKVRLTDKLALVNALVSRAVGASNITLSDDDVLTVLAAWAALEQRRYGSEDPIDLPFSGDATAEPDLSKIGGE